VEFERSLITPNSRFDRYLLGDESAITAEEKAGYALFKSYGCVACHQGRNVGGNMFQIFGVMDDYFANRGHITDADYGRFNVTGREEDRFHFRVPSLRNVALTAPYFHDGTAESLDQAVMVMARYQLGVTMPAEDVGLIVKFLGTLTGEYKGQPL
jgi:cytochrome c peroxidase